MSGLHKSIKKVLPKEIRSPIDKKIEKEVISSYQSVTPKMPSADDSPVIPMADEEEIRRSKRRGQAARGGGRASTILTESDRLGP